MSRPGVLLVTTSPLLPLHAGGRMYTWGTTAPLADSYDYHLVALATPTERAEQEADRTALDELYGRVFRSVQIFDRPVIPGHRERRREVLKHLWFHSRHGLPLMDVSYYSPEVVAAARRLVEAGAVDVIEVDHAQMAFVRRFVDDVPAILVNHNTEGELHPFWMTDRWNPLELVVWRAFAAVSRRNTRRIERDNAYGFSSKLYISPVDAAKASDDCPKIYLPMPFEVVPEERSFPAERLRLLWLGGFDWPPNLEGMRWFLERVWPRVATDERFQLDVVGTSPPPDITRHSGERVRVHGFVEDVSSSLASADALVAPLLSGSGVRVKVAEALSRGLPVVSTPKGLEGLTAVAGRDLLVAAGPEAFAAELLRLADSTDLRRSLSTHGREYVRRAHSLTTIAATKAGALDAAIASSHPAR